MYDIGTRAYSLKVTSYPNPESKQLILDNVYEIKVEIFDRDEHPVYPSEVIASIYFHSSLFLFLDLDKMTERVKEVDIQADRHTDKHKSDKHKDRQNDRQTGIQADRQTVI